MKRYKIISKIFLTTTLLLSGIFFNQTNAQLKIGGGLAYGSEINEAGFNLRVGARVTDYFMFDADMNYFFYGDEGWYEYDLVGYNLNGKFLLPAGNQVYLYPYAGINYTVTRSESFFGTSSRDEIGFNLGGGISADLGPVSPFVEGKYIFSEFDQAVFNVGFVFNLGERY